jgi:molybdate transport system substrate-binding protein
MRLSHVRGYALAALCLVLAAGCASGTSTDAERATQVRVAAAADLKFALGDIEEALADARPDLELVVSYGSSGTFFQQLSEGAPYDLFLSADLAFPERLAEDGLAAPDDVFSYAVGRIVVWAPDGSPADPDLGLEALADPAVRKVAIANPEHAPYGQAAVAAMRSAGVYDAVEGKLVLGENVAQAAEFAWGGDAQAGVFALSLALAPEFTDRGAYTAVPLDSYPRIDQGGVVVGHAANPDGARAVRDFIVGEEGRAILERWGFSMPED